MSKSAFGFLQPEDSPGFLLWQVTASWQRMIKAALEPHNITHPQFVVMALLLWFKEQGIEPKQSMLINKSKMDKMTISVSIKKLVQLGLIQRKECCDDTRAKIVNLTAKGRALTKKLMTLVEKVDADYFARISTLDQNSLKRIFKQFVDE